MRTQKMNHRHIQTCTSPLINQYALPAVTTQDLQPHILCGERPIPLALFTWLTSCSCRKRSPQENVVALAGGCDVRMATRALTVTSRSAMPRSCRFFFNATVLCFPERHEMCDPSRCHDHEVQNLGWMDRCMLLFIHFRCKETRRRNYSRHTLDVWRGFRHMNSLIFQSQLSEIFDKLTPFGRLLLLSSSFNRNT